MAKKQGQGPSRYVARYMTQLRDREVTQRTSAASYLGMLGPDAAPAIPALIASTSDESKYVRRAAVKALGNIGVRSPEVKDALTRASRDRDRFVAASAGKSLRMLEKGSRSTSTPLYTAR